MILARVGPEVVGEDVGPFVVVRVVGLWSPFVRVVTDNQ